jgi:hypothetical protein
MNKGELILVPIKILIKKFNYKGKYILLDGKLLKLLRSIVDDSC